MMPIQPGDVLETSADTKALYDVIGFKPQTSVKEGVKTSSTGTATSITFVTKPGRAPGFYITILISRCRTNRGYRLYLSRPPALPPYGWR